jgi:hypothetical protein
MNIMQKALLNLKVSGREANTIEWYNKPEIILSEDDNGYPYGIRMAN